MIAATVAATGGDSDSAAQLAPVLDQMAEDQDWAALGTVLRRIIGGDRDASLLQGLNPIGTAITGQVPFPACPTTGYARAGGSMTSIIGTIAALTGEEAIRVLADTADYQNPLPDPAELRALETGLRDATTFTRHFAGGQHSEGIPQHVEF